MEQCRILGEYAQYVEKVRENAEVIAMSIFEYDKEEEEQKLQAIYEKQGELRKEKKHSHLACAGRRIRRKDSKNPW